MLRSGKAAPADHEAESLAVQVRMLEYHHDADQADAG